MNKKVLFDRLGELRARLLGELSAREGMEYISKLPTEALIAEAEADGVDFTEAIEQSQKSFR